MKTHPSERAEAITWLIALILLPLASWGARHLSKGHGTESQVVRAWPANQQYRTPACRVADFPAIQEPRVTRVASLEQWESVPHDRERVDLHTEGATLFADYYGYARGKVIQFRKKLADGGVGLHKVLWLPDWEDNSVTLVKTEMMTGSNDLFFVLFLMTAGCSVVAWLATVGGLVWDGLEG